MRQGQQNRRGRGRNNNNNNNNNRKNQNPLSRSFESNGPDVKIRGTPAHIAEKYMALARDAQSSGDHVLAENYLQHAEHYNRIIMAYREQFAPQHGEGSNGQARQQHGEGGEDLAEDENEDILDEGFQGAQPVAQQFQPQPPTHRHQDSHRFDNSGRDNRDNRDHRGDRPFRRDQGRFRDRDRGGDRQVRGDERQPSIREDRPPVREERHQPQEHAAEPMEPRRQPRERFQQPHEQPDFLRRPVRRPRMENSDAPAAAGGKDEPSRE